MADPVIKSSNVIIMAISRGWGWRRWRISLSASLLPPGTEFELLHMNLARGLGVIKRFDAIRLIGGVFILDPPRPKWGRPLRQNVKEKKLNYFY
jgi:hypothetical protein